MKKNKKPNIIFLFWLLIMLSLVSMTFIAEWYPNYLVIEPFIQYRPFLTILTLLLSFFLLWRKYSGLALVGLLLVAFSTYTILEGYNGTWLKTSQLNCQSDEVVQPLRVMSFNLLYKTKDYQGLFKSIEAVDPDIVTLQEVQSGFHNHAHAPLMQLFPYYYTDMERNIAHGKSIYSKYPIEKTVKPALRGHRNRLIKSVINVSGQKVNLFTTHLFSPKSTERVIDRNSDIYALSAYLKLQMNNDVPSILTGDFNSAPWHPAMRTLKRQTRLNNNEFYNIVRTWPTWLPAFLSIPIDHIYHSNEFKHLKYYKGLKTGSDHYSVYVDLEFCR